MSEGQRVWFVYLGDHHEGPFTAAEIAQKAAQGLVNGKSLVWKDGMPEWVVAGSIPEIDAAISSAASPAPAALSAADGLSLDIGGGGNEEPSLAQILAQSQQQEAPLSEGASASLSLDAPVSSEPIHNSESVVSKNEPGEHEQVWTMRSGTSVSGLFTMQTLKEMAAIGEIPADAHFWHPGNSDFISLAELPALAALRKDKKPVKRVATASPTAPKGLAPLVANADVGEDEDTSTALEVPQQKKFAFLDKFKNFFKRKEKIGKKVVAQEKAQPKKAAGVGARSKRSVSLVRPILMLVGILSVVGAAAAVYFLVLASPIPDMEDVKPADLEKMRAVVKSPEAGTFFLARAVGDDVTPTFYVATNLAEGVSVTLEFEGVSGTLVNALHFKKQFSSTVDQRRLAVFSAVSDNSKPLPMGDYHVTISSPGAQPLKELVFIGLAKKNHIYERRMAQYKQKLQEQYDQEMQELKEYLSTERSLFEGLTAKITQGLLLSGNQAQKAQIFKEWSIFLDSHNKMAQEIEKKLKESIGSPQFSERIYPDQLKRLLDLIGKIGVLAQEEDQRIRNGTAPVKTGTGEAIKQEFSELDSWLATALMRSPIEALTERKTEAQITPATPATEAVKESP